MSIQPLDIVVLAVDIPAHGLKCGDLGTVVDVYAPDAIEVEFVMASGRTKALVTLYYGRAPRYSYYDGHSQGGRQGLKIAQQYPELYDGYLIGQPAISPPMFGTEAIYPQLEMKAELGYTAADKVQAAAFAKKVEAANKRAVAQCDKAGLGRSLVDHHGKPRNHLAIIFRTVHAPQLGQPRRRNDWRRDDQRMRPARR